jgi:hypothetical protein
VAHGHYTLVVDTLSPLTPEFYYSCTLVYSE